MTDGALLQIEIATFNKEKQHPESEHAGKHVLIHRKVVVGAYDTFQRAATEGVWRFGDDGFLVRKVGEGEGVLLSPAILHEFTGAGSQV